VIDWAALIEKDFAVPDDLGAAVHELVAMLAAADPAVRDDQAYPVLVTWIRRGVLDGRPAAIGDTMVERLGHPEVQARTFAPLILAAAVDRDAVAHLLDPPTVRRWRDAFVAWWLAETDIRGWDDRLGWLHAVAHGVDLAGALGASPRLSAAELAGLLTVVAERVVAPTGYRYAQMEEDRVARATIRILARPELPAASATGWLDTVDRLLATGEPGPLPIPVANTLAVLRAMYVMADRRALPHRAAVTDAIAARLHEFFDAYPAIQE
jgi:predicted pyridoxine 5'-phosphate oxidase superfamily flavin-nucleotide-binding protein